MGFGFFHGYGEMVVVATCVGVIAASPLGVHGETWAVIAWTAASNVASYIKGKLESKPGAPPPPAGTKDDPVHTEVGNSPSDPVPTVEADKEKKDA